MLQCGKNERHRGAEVGRKRKQFGTAGVKEEVSGGGVSQSGRAWLQGWGNRNSCLWQVPMASGALSQATCRWGLARKGWTCQGPTLRPNEYPSAGGWLAWVHSGSPAGSCWPSRGPRVGLQPGKPSDQGRVNRRPSWEVTCSLTHLQLVDPQTSGKYQLTVDKLRETPGSKAWQIATV